MNEWKLRRFWTSVDTVEKDGAVSIRLDGRLVKTPAKATLVLPNQALAQAVAQEWNAQKEEINPTLMPMTRMANSAIDKVRPQQAEIADMLAGYGATDLVCYRADSPQELVVRQEKAWNPLLDWAATELGARLLPTAGIMPVSQNAEALAQFSRHVHALDHFTLSGFHDLVSLSGSLVIGFAVLRQYQMVENLWTCSRIDEIWQEEQWGEDEEATEQTRVRTQAFCDAAQFCALVNA